MLTFKGLGYLVNSRQYVYTFLSFSFQPSFFTLASLIMGGRRHRLVLCHLLPCFGTVLYRLRTAYWLLLFLNRCHGRAEYGVAKPFILFVVLKSQLVFKGLRDLIHSPLIFLGITHVHPSLVHSSHSCLCVLSNLTPAPKQS